MDRNGYNPSIMETEDGVCFLCGICAQTVRHEIYGGNPNRTISKRMGFWVNLCTACHRKVHEVYTREEVRQMLKKPCEIMYQRTHSRDSFYELIGEYYDEDP